MKSHARFRGLWQNVITGTLTEQADEIVVPLKDVFLWQDINKKEYWAIINTPSNTYKLDKLEYERVAKLLTEETGRDDEVPERKLDNPMERMDV